MFRGICRTPPGVRELKRRTQPHVLNDTPRRTPPGVRELKRRTQPHVLNDTPVAPLPGCVN